MSEKQSEGAADVVVGGIPPKGAQRITHTQAVLLLISERDSLRSQLADACGVLERVDTDLRLFFDADAVCDHSVNICWCEYNRMREAMRSTLARIKGAAP